jgi:hypothetical protein
VSVQSLLGREYHTRVGALLLDRLVGLQHRAAGRATLYPVEDGSPITDHISHEPEVVTLEGEVTNSPIRILGGRLTLAGPDLSSRPNFCQQAFDYLSAVRDEKRLISVETRYRTYQDVVVEEFEVPRAAGDGEKIRIRLVFRAIRQALLRTFDSRPLRTKKQSAQPKQKVGPQPAAPASSAASGRVSILKGALQALGVN